MADISIIRLTAGDVNRMKALNALFGRAFDDYAHYLADPPDDDYLARILALEHVIALVAYLDETMAGGIVAYELDKLEQNQREIYLYDLAVEEAQRRRGVATALIERLRRIASERGARVVYVQAEHGDDPAIALYEKLGVREDVMHFDIPAPERSS